MGQGNGVAGARAFGLCLFLSAQVFGEGFLEGEAGEAVDTLGDIGQDGEDNGHGGNGDDDVGPAGHGPDLGIKGGGIDGGVGTDNEGGEEVIEDGAEEEGEGEEDGGAAEEAIHGGLVLAVGEGTLDFLDVKNFGGKDECADEGVAGEEGSEDGQPDDGGDGGFLDNEVLAGQFEEADAAGEEDADEAEDGDEVGFAAFFVVVNKIRCGEGEGDDEDDSGP